MKFMLVLVSSSLCACRNDAITVAHQIDPTAECRAIGMSWGIDKAVCRSGTEVWSCTGNPPKCEKIADVKVEKP